MTQPSSEQLAYNQIRYKDFRLSLPEGWCVFAQNQKQGSGIVLRFVKSKSNSYGRYETFKYLKEEISPQQIITLLKTQQYDKIGSVEVHKSNNKWTDFYILSQEKPNDSNSSVLLAFLTLKGDNIHLVQFILNPSSGSPQELFNYVFHSLSYYDYSLLYYGYKFFARQRKSHINFFQNSSTFQWYSDTPTGLVLQGKILDKPAFITIEKAKNQNHIILIDENSLPLLINNRRVWVHHRSHILENGIYKMEAVFPAPRSGSSNYVFYTFSCLIDPQGEEITNKQILTARNLRYLFQRELFFPQSGAK